MLSWQVKQFEPTSGRETRLPSRSDRDQKRLAIASGSLRESNRHLNRQWEERHDDEDGRCDEEGGLPVGMAVCGSGQRVVPPSGHEQNPAGPAAALCEYERRCRSRAASVWVCGGLCCFLRLSPQTHTHMRKHVDLCGLKANLLLSCTNSVPHFSSLFQQLMQQQVSCNPATVKHIKRNKMY